MRKLQAELGHTPIFEHQATQEIGKKMSILAKVNIRKSEKFPLLFIWAYNTFIGFSTSQKAPENNMQWTIHWVFEKIKNFKRNGPIWEVRRNTHLGNWDTQAIAEKYTNIIFSIAV